MKTPLYDAVLNYNADLRLHMPGHGGLNSISPLYSGANFDVTELDFSDNLLDAKGVILQAEKLTAKSYKSDYCLFFTSGCTSALFVAILAAKEAVDKFYCLDTPHKSIINAFELFKIDYEIVSELPADALGIIITTPDYYGNLLDVKLIRKRHPHAFIIVDEAHGAHFAFSSLLPDNVGAEADFVVNGMHKTMPVFTGGSILRTQSKILYERALELRAKVHSTSPSYMVMCSMDYARGYFDDNGESLYKTLKSKLDNLKLPDGFKRVKNDDFTRLVIQVPPHATGYEVNKDAQQKGIYFELVEDRLLVAILTPFNMDRIDRLSELNPSPPPVINKDLYKYIGMIADKDIGLYPPGKVYIKKGETITKEIIEVLNKDSERVFGLN